MWSISMVLVALVLVLITQRMFRWWNSKPRNVKLPPGSMGLPFIGETFQFFTPGKSLDVPPFLKKRTERYGPIFKTRLAGRPVVISSDADFNHFILQQEGKLVEFWYLDSFAKILDQNGSLKDGLTSGYIHKYLKKTIWEHVGIEVLKGRRELLALMEEAINSGLLSWTEKEFVELKQAISTMVLNFTSKLLFGYDPEKSDVNLSDALERFTQGLLSIPLDLPGTPFRRCMRIKNKVLSMIREEIKQRSTYPEKRRGDFLDHMINDMNAESFLNEDVMSYVVFVLLLATSETLPSNLALAIKLVINHPLVMEELLKERKRILDNSENAGMGISWKEYKSMTFTMHVISEALRIASTALMFRRAIKDIQVNGYTIPKGWTIAIMSSGLHLNGDTYKDPLNFNPWRWKDWHVNVGTKSFVPFGGGSRSCVGSEYSKVFMLMFLTTFITKYRCIEVKGGEIMRAPTLCFKDGYYIKVLPKP